MYASRVLDRREINYSTTRRELLAIVHFVKYFKHLLLNGEFILRTDHHALTYLFSCKEPLGQMARWTEILSEFKFQIEYRPGPCHANVDALSRYPHAVSHPPDADDSSQPLTNHTLSISAIQQPRTEMNTSWIASLNFIRDKQQADSIIQQLSSWVINGFPPREEIQEMNPSLKIWLFQKDSVIVKDELLYRRHALGTLQIIIPNSLKTEFLKSIHGNKLTGHFGQTRTRLLVRRKAYWLGWASDVKRFVMCCPLCQQRGPKPR